MARVRELIDGGFLLVESDLIYEQQALHQVLNDDRPDVLLLSGSTDFEDSVYVGGAGDRVAWIAKTHTRPEPIVGEYVGICKISASLFRRLLNCADRALSANPRLDYDMDMMSAVAATHPIHFQVVEDLVWAEIDNHRQLAVARDDVYPRILQSELQ